MPAYPPRIDTRIVSRTPRGQALWCSCCNRVEIALGNAILTLGDADMDSLLAILDSFLLDASAGSSQRCFLIRTEHDEGGFAFNAAEVRELRSLVSEARGQFRSSVPLENLVRSTGFLH